MRERVSDLEWKQIKWRLRFSKNIAAIAKRSGRSVATITRIMSTKSFEEYQNLVRAEHPPINHSTLGDRVSDLEVRVERLEQK